MSKDPEILTRDLIDSLRAMCIEPGLKQRVHERLTLSLMGLGHVTTSLAESPSGIEPTLSTTDVPSPLHTNSSQGRQSGMDDLLMTRLVPARLSAVKPLISGAASPNWAWLLPVFAAGALVGGAADRWLLTRDASVSEPTSRVVQDATSKAEAKTNAMPSALPLAEVPAPDISERASVVTPPIAAVSAAPTSSLAEERKLLDEARRALARGEAQAGVASLERHVKRFPKGALVEEREALYVRVLAAAGNDEAASRRAAGFQRRFPNSIFLPVVERAALSISRQNAAAQPKP